MSIYPAFITLLLVLDPFGNIPLFMSTLERVAPARRRYVILREMLIALGILTVFLFFGRFILEGMQISEPALGIAGGVILFIIAMRMIFPEYIPLNSGRTEPGDAPLIVPLAVPFVAGPSSMTTVLLLASQNPGRKGLLFAALLSAWGVTAVVLLASALLTRILGNRVIKAVERLMGMILTTLAVQMLLSGITEYLRHLAPGRLRPAAG